MPRLWIVETGHRLGELTAAQVEFLAEHLVKEDAGDMDYDIIPETVTYLEELGADAALVDTLRLALEMVPGQRAVTVSFRPAAAVYPGPRGPFR